MNDTEVTGSYHPTPCNKGNNSRASWVRPG